MSATELRVRPDAERTDAALTTEDRLALLRYMLLMRLSEERALKLYKQGKVPGSFYDGCGQEAISVGAAFALAPEDRLCILHRDLGAHFVRGLPPDRYMANYMGRAGGVTGGKDGNMHFGDRSLGCVGMVSMLPDMALVANGLALAFKLRSEPRVALTFFGEGSTANGQWHEAMNLAGVQRLPVVFMLENNQFAYSTPNRLEFAVDPIERAETYGFEGVSVDGNDVEATFAAANAAVERARAGGGPTLIECQTMRMHGHGAHDDMSYVPEQMLAEWRERDPIDRYTERLRAEPGIDPERLERLRAEVADEVERCAERALASPMPDPATATDGVFAERWQPLGDGAAPWSRWADRGREGVAA
jgi:TPP-dependent pyruvate/acetoin dehydrogenase alpha subunit